MRVRRLICFGLGLWLGGGLLIDWLAFSGFREADRLLAQPGSAGLEGIRTLGYGHARALLRYQVAEQNRSYFEAWETVQLVGGSALFFYLLFGTSEKKFGLIIVAAMVAIAAVQRFLLTPQLASIENTLPSLPARRDAFWAMHSAYSGLEALKWGLALALAGKSVFARRRSHSDDAGDDFDLVDKANYRHVNR